MKNRILEFIRAPDYRPLKDHDLADAMGVLTHQRNAFRTALRDLADEGVIERIKGNRWAPVAAAKAGPVRTGTISVSPQGHGMVRIPGQTGPEAEFFIGPEDLGGALHGDLVEVEPLESAHRRARREAAPPTGGTRMLRPGGRVVRVVERRKAILVGRLMQSPAYWYVIPDHLRIRQNIYVSGIDLGPKYRPVAGHKVVVRLDPGLHGEMLSGRMIEDLGEADAPGVDVLGILREHEIATEFSKAAEQEARDREPTLTRADLAGRLDLRDECVITIDPADARDHDDAVSLRRTPDGGSILGVHIADVSHFVTPGSAIDRDARRNGNSVYMVDRFLPMLPPHLTGAVCSLHAGKDRLAYSVFITYNAHAEVTQVEMRASVVHPRILLDYDRVQAFIKNGVTSAVPAEYHQVISDMHDLATRLRRHRVKTGTLELAMPEVSCTLDDQGRPVAIKRRSSPEAYHLIEEFMLAANVAVADRLYNAHIPAIYRIHDEPSEEQWQQMALDLKQLGITADPTDRHDIQRIASSYVGQPLSYPVSIALLRNFKRAVYSSECRPHFGLAFDRYTHFTSPIRRYSDLVVHRTLKSLDSGHGGPYRSDECEEVAEHCSRREREAAEAEEESLIIKRIQYYELLQERGETGPWPALVTGSTPRGLLVELVDTLQRGFVPSHTLPDPDLKFDRENGRILGRKGREFLRIGQVISTSLLRVDHARRSVELEWLDTSGQTARRGGGGGNGGGPSRGKGKGKGGGTSSEAPKRSRRSGGGGRGGRQRSR
jgi:ribonuclease R